MNDCRKGDITKIQKVFKGKEGTIVHQFENLLKNHSGPNFRIIVDEWLLPNLFFSAIKAKKTIQLRELLEYKPSLVTSLDIQQNNVFHVLAASDSADSAEDILSLVLLAFKDEDEILSILNKDNVFEDTPLHLAIKLRKRR